jgi:hypothetical protein
MGAHYLAPVMIRLAKFGTIRCKLAQGTKYMPSSQHILRRRGIVSNERQSHDSLHERLFWSGPFSSVAAVKRAVFVLIPMQLSARASCK